MKVALHVRSLAKCNFSFLIYILPLGEHAVVYLGEALCYKPERSIPVEVIGFFFQLT
jgi:hypothetical protein